MSIVFQVICIMVVAYLIGGINPSYIIARVRSFDIRESGSGNAGASNAFITMGAKAGLFSMLFDIFKAFLAVRLAIYFFPFLKFAGALAGASVITGHIYPIFMGFRGGKGLAALGGSILAFDWRFFLIILACEFILALIVDYICIVPITASVIFPVVYLCMTGEVVGTCLLFLAAVLILNKHVENIRRIKEGSEAHFSYVWNKDKEVARLQKNKDDREAADKNETASTEANEAI